MSERTVPYLPADWSTPPELVAAIRARRGGELLLLDRMLLHSAPFAAGWNAHLREVRQHLSLDARLRELAICGVAVLNRAEYEFVQHAPHFLRGGGTQAQLDALRHLGGDDFSRTPFDGLEADVCTLTLQMTRSIETDPALMARLRDALGNTALVELVGVIATYNMVSRFLVALQIHPPAA